LVLLLEPSLVAAQVYIPEVLWMQECRVLRVLQLPVATARGVGDVALVGAQGRTNQRMAAGAEGKSSVSSYRVGEVTRGVLAMGRITRGSEDKSYKFGDFTRGLLAPSSIETASPMESDARALCHGRLRKPCKLKADQYWPAGAAMRKLKAEAAGQSAVQILESAADRGIFEDRLQAMGEGPAHIVQAQAVPTPPVPPISKAGRQLYTIRRGNRRR
jgi:hypothetical protein